MESSTLEIMKSEFPCDLKNNAIHMKNITRHLVLAWLLAVSTIAPGFSQDEQQNNNAVEMAKMRTEKQKEVLNLNEQQEKLMYDVNLKYINEVQQIRTEGRSVSTLKKLMDMSNRMDKEVVTFLDEAQYKGYLALKEERRKEMMKQMKAQQGNG